MAGGGCCNGNDAIIKAGNGIKVTGSGTVSNPYRIEADQPDFGDVLKVQDTETVNLTLTGAGTLASPFRIKADADIALTALKDVADGVPDIGDVPVWDGTQFVLSAPPAAPAGAVNAGQGIGGIGSVGDPLKVLVSGVWGVGALDDLGDDDTVGGEIYLDSNGELRAQPTTAASVEWDDISNRPGSFTPSEHTHPAGDITEQVNLDVGKINGRRIYATATSAAAPAVTSAYDLWFFPEGT